MATAKNRDLIGLGYPPGADGWNSDGLFWLRANFDAAQWWHEPAGANEFDPDPPGAPNRGYCGKTDFGEPSIRMGRAGRGRGRVT
jgi:hypothetical protein